MAIVTAFSIIERLLGFIYRIFLSRTLGSEGLGIYQVSLSVVGLIMTLTASGIPITVSRIMTKHTAENKQNLNFSTVTAGILMSLIISVPIVLILLIFPSLFGFLFADNRSYILLKIMLPGVIITSVYSVIRGYFWGEKRFFTYSIIELLEETVMLVTGILFVYNQTSLKGGIVGAANAVLTSYLFSFVTAFILYFAQGGKIKSPKKELVPLISASSPITVMRTSASLINTLIAIILPLRLVLNGMSKSLAISAFGELSGMSIPLIYIPSTLIGSIALVLVPELSNNYYRNSNISLKNNIEKAVKCSVFISCMIIPTFLCLGKEIGVLLYNNFNAGIYVQRASIIMLPMSITLITTSILNSLNLEKKTLLYYMIGAFFLVVSIYFLPKYIGVYSLILGLLVSYLITAICNLTLINKTCKHKPKYTLFIIVSTLFIIPTTLFGYLLKGILALFVPSIIVILICSISMVIFIYLLFKVFGIFDLKNALI